MQKLFLYTAMALFVATLQCCFHTPAVTEPSDLASCLSRLEGFVALGPLQKAGNEAELFALINGGASFYIKHGFTRAVFQEYKDPNGRRIAIGIFEMKDTHAAHDVYRVQAGAGTKNITLGDEAVLEEYYVLLRRGRYYITVTGFDSDKQTRDTLITIAGNLDQKIASSK
jgi:hypothetical protein